MKINYDLTNNYFKNINIATGIHWKRKQIIKNPNKNIQKATTQILILLGYSIISILLYVLTIYINLPIQTLLYYVGAILLLFTFMHFVSFFLTYKRYKKGFTKGTLNITQEYVENSYDNSTTTQISWDKVSFIVLKDNLLIISTLVENLQLMSTINNEEVNNIIDLMKQYKNDILIINKMEK